MVAGLGLALAVFVASCGGSTQESTTTQAGATTTGAPTSETATTNAVVTLNAVSFLPTSHPLTGTLKDWIAAVDQATQGTVKINWKGGPEVIPAMDQIEAVRNGVVDINFNVTAYYENLNPALRASSLSPFEPWEERANGVFDFLKREHEKVGVVYVGRWMGDLPFYVFINKPITSPDELKGMSLRTRAQYDRFFKALGASAVSIDQGEVYTALERGIIQGFGWPMLGVKDAGWDTKVKYVIDHGFYKANNAVILFNPKSWEKLSQSQRDAISQATADYEKNLMVPYDQKAQEEERQKLAQDGVTFIKFSQADADRYVNLAYKVEWDNLEKEVPDKFAEIKTLFNIK